MRYLLAFVLVTGACDNEPKIGLPDAMVDAASDAEVDASIDAPTDGWPDAFPPPDADWWADGNPADAGWWPDGNPSDGGWWADASVPTDGGWWPDGNTIDGNPADAGWWPDAAPPQDGGWWADASLADAGPAICTLPSVISQPSGFQDTAFNTPADANNPAYTSIYSQLDQSALPDVLLVQFAWQGSFANGIISPGTYTGDPNVFVAGFSDTDLPNNQFDQIYIMTSGSVVVHTGSPNLDVSIENGVLSQIDITTGAMLSCITMVNDYRITATVP